MRKSPKPPPEHLGERGSSFWTQVVSEFDIEPHDQSLLTACAEMLDRAESARVQVAKEGMTFRDRFGQVKSHPACEIERQSLLAFVRIRREMGIDVEPPDSRPPLPRGYR